MAAPALNKFAKLYNSGYSIAEIRDILGVSTNRMFVLRNKAASHGLITVRGSREEHKLSSRYQRFQQVLAIVKNQGFRVEWIFAAQHFGNIQPPGQSCSEADILRYIDQVQRYTAKRHIS